MKKNLFIKSLYFPISVFNSKNFLHFACLCNNHNNNLKKNLDERLEKVSKIIIKKKYFYLNVSSIIIEF